MLVVEMSGAVMVLLAFVLTQRGVPAWTPALLVLNAVGAGALAAIAWHEARWGFLLLEGTWTLVAVVALVTQLLRAAQADSATTSSIGTGTRSTSQARCTTSTGTPASRADS